MKAFLLLSTLLVGMAQASPLDDLPGCAMNCFENSLSLSTCSSQNITCLCDDVNFQNAVAGCSAVSCTPKQLLTTTNATYTACGLPSHDASPTMIGIPASFGSLAILFVVTRICARLFINNFFAWDDWFIVAAMILACPLNFLLFPMAESGMGRDIWTIPFDQLRMTLKDLYFAEIFYMISELFTQLSILAFYLRVFSSRTFRKVTIGLMIFAACFGISNTMTMILQCSPVSFLWEGWTGEVQGSCININLYSWIRASIEIVVDLAIISLPIPLLLRLRLNWTKKVQIILMFSVGFLITLVSILRLKSLIQFSKSTNLTYDNAPAVYWSVLECDIAIVCACMPAVRVVLGHVFPSLFGSSFNSAHDSKKPESEEVPISHPDHEVGSMTPSVVWGMGHTEQPSPDVEMVEVANKSRLERS